jgi:hypothetical protein
MSVRRVIGGVEGGVGVIKTSPEITVQGRWTYRSSQTLWLTSKRRLSLSLSLSMETIQLELTRVGGCKHVTCRVLQQSGALAPSLNVWCDLVKLLSTAIYYFTQIWNKLTRLHAIIRRYHVYKIRVQILFAAQINDLLNKTHLHI